MILVMAVHLIMVVIVLLVIMVSTVVMFETQNEDRSSIDNQTEDRDENRLIVCNTYRVYQPLYALPCHHQCENTQQNRPCESAQSVDLSGAETVSRVVSVTAATRRRTNLVERRIRNTPKCLDGPNSHHYAYKKGA